MLKARHEIPGLKAAASFLQHYPLQAEAQVSEAGNESYETAITICRRINIDQTSLQGIERNPVYPDRYSKQFAFFKPFIEAHYA